MKRHLMWNLSILIVLAMISTACSTPKTESPQETAASVERPTRTPRPTKTPAATATPEILLAEAQRVEEGGYSFRPIPGYTLNVAMGIVEMVAPGADADNGPVINIFGGVSEGMTAEQLYEGLKGQPDITLSEAQPITVQGVTGLVGDITTRRDDGEMSGRIVILMPTAEQQFAIMGGAPKERWENELLPLFEAVLNSVTFFDPAPIPQPTMAPTPEPVVETTPVEPVDQVEWVEIRQWASMGMASSEYGSSNWAASQATGAPDVDACGDNATAWAASSSDTVEWIELTYGAPVYPTQVNIHITYNPSYVSRVELLDTEGVYHQIYSFEAREVAECPYVMSIDVTEAGFQAVAVKVTIDQTTLLNWVEIDAVELVGQGDPDFIPALPEATAEPTQVSFDPPAGFLWRAGGDSGVGANEFAALGGMDAAADGTLYVADNIKGVLVFDPAGNWVNTIKSEAVNNASDVVIGPDGNLYVAAWGSNNVLVFTPDGQELRHFGVEGKENGQFGGFSPQSLAVAPDGKVYVLDDNEDASDESYTRVQVFDAQGNFLNTFPITEDFFAAEEMAFGPDGTLYILGFVGGSILKYSQTGEFLGKIGEEALGFTGPYDLDIDLAGNIYVAIWTPDSVVKLDPDGNLVSQWGVVIENGELAWPEGGFYSLAGVAVKPDGEMVFASDWSGNFAYITAFQME